MVENTLGDEAALCTDAELVQQILGNLLDNACKYSRGAADPRVWLRLRGDGRRLVFEIEDQRPRHSEIREAVDLPRLPSRSHCGRDGRRRRPGFGAGAALGGTGRRRADVATEIDGRRGVFPAGSSHRRELRWN